MRIKTYKAKRVVCLSMAILFILSDITAWASHDAHDTNTLAPSTSLRQEEFKSRVFTAGALLSHEAENAYIEREIEKIIELRGEDWLKEHVTEGVVPIPGLLERTAQFAHLGLGRKYAKPVIYVDADIYNDKSSLQEVIKHELDERNGWEDIRHSLRLAPSGMRQWIRDHISSQDPKLLGTKYAGLTSVEIARQIHESSHSLENLYKKHSERINIREDYLLDLLSNYGEGQESAGAVLYDPNKSKDVNIAAPVTQEIPSEADRAEVAESWIEKNAAQLNNNIVFCLSMEGMVPAFEGHPAQDANTKGGLGAFYGDLGGAMLGISVRGAGDSRIIKDSSGKMRLEWASKDGMHPIGAQPGYSSIINKYGEETKVDYDALVKDGIMEKVLVGRNAIMVRAWSEDIEARKEDAKDTDNPQVKVEVYRVNNAGTWVYIFRSPKVFDILYNDNRVRRFTQEIVFGKAVYEFAKKLNIIPDILHLNEAHTVVAAAQMRADDRFNDMAIVYTVHTPVAAGLERFSPGSLNTTFDRMMYVLAGPEAEKLKSEFLSQDGTVDFCHAAMTFADIINAPSDESARAVEKLFKNMYPGKFNKYVVGVLNGSGPAWKSNRLKAEEEKGPPSEDKLMRIHDECKQEAYQEICDRTGVRLDPNKPTFWMVRRLVEYKSQYPMLRFLVHILTADKNVTFTRDQLRAAWLHDIPSLGYDRDLVESVLNKIFKDGKLETVNGLGAQIVVGGPVYMDFWEQEFKRWSNDISEFKGRFVYVPYSDTKLLKMQAIGADVCITVPEPLKEACGTSDQRTGLNGGVNISIKGAGPVEWMIDYNENTQDGCGFFIGSYTKKTLSGELEADIEKFYNEAPADILDKCKIASRLFYEDKGKWKRLMHNSYLQANEIVSAVAMVERYARKAYLPAVRSKRNKNIINEIVIRDYCDEAAGISGLKNAEKEITFLAEAGVRYVSLVGLMSNSGSPLEVIDSMAIDKRAGSFEDLQDFVDKAHSLGIFVIMDWLANQHVHKSNKICEEHPERFLYTNVIDGNYGLDTKSWLYRGKDIPLEELRKRIEFGKKILKELKKIPEDKLNELGELKIDESKITLQPGDREMPKQISGAQDGSVIPMIVPEECPALFLVSATERVKDVFKRFESLAQPDLGHPDVIKNSIEIGRFWLGRGLDGFRVGAALSTFRDRIEENWGIEVYENLTGNFIKEMRSVRPDCFFLFEGSERQKELLALAGDTGRAAYADESRRYITDVLTDKNKFPNLADYLRKLESVPSETRENLVNLGPEHDAEDAWAKLSYQDKNIMYFLYTFLPGYSLIFNGEIYGVNRTAKPPTLADLDPAIRDVRRKIFSFPMVYKQLLSGGYSYLETDAPSHAMGVARFDNDDILIGAFNVTQNSGWAALSLQRLINMQTEPSGLGLESFSYIKESLKLDKDGREWISIERQEIPARKLYIEGLKVNTGPKGCEIIRLKKVAVPAAARKGSPSQCFKYLFDNKVFSKDKALTASDLTKARKYSDTTVRIELKTLAALGIVEIMNTSKGKSYYLNENFGRSPPETALEVFNKIFSIKELNRYIVPEKHIPLLSRRIKNILNALGADSEAAISRITDKRVSAALEALSFKAISDKMASGMVYEIRYNEDRIRECPLGEDIIKEYVKLLKGRSRMSSNIILRPSKKVKLLSISSYEDESHRSAGEVFGEGVVDIKCGDKEIPLLGVLDIAFAASNIRSSVQHSYSDMDESEKRLIRFIKEECLVITGLKTDDIKDDMILEFIKSLPKPAPLPIDSIEHNRLTLQKLQQAA